MKFALVGNQRQEAQPRLSGRCPVCDQPMTAKCGEHKMWHWAHRGKRHCDPWWENETEWHRGWKNQFPVDWQEFRQVAETGERHIADVKTDRGWVIEFQYSFLNSEERRARNSFNSKLVWVVNGARRKKDRQQFTRALSDGHQISRIVWHVFVDECALLREWAGSEKPTFFDFGEGPALWWLLGSRPNGVAYVAPFSRAEFVEIHRSGATSGFDDLTRDLSKLISEYESRR